MIGNPVDYNKKYIKNSPLWSSPTLDNELTQYLELLKGRNILDLGIGEGQNSIALSKLGYNVTGVDCSSKALDICRSNCNNIELIEEDIRNFYIQTNKYDLIISRFVLHFLHKNDVFSIIKNIKNNIKTNGLVYISVFSTNDPGLKFKHNSPDFDTLENNVFHKISDNTYSSYFSKDEILNLFSGFNTILISDEYSIDLSHGTPHYHGIIKYIGDKI